MTKLRKEVKNFPRRRPKKSSYIGVYIEDGMKDSIERLAVAKDVSVGKILREALSQYLNRENLTASQTA